MERYRQIIPDFDEFMRVIDTPQPNDVRVNTIKSDLEEVASFLREEGVAFEQLEWNEKFLRLDAEPGKTFAHWLGLYYVQESTSGVPPLALDPQPGESVLDLCAAPGSKTTQMAAMMDNRGEILANDKSHGKVRALMANLYQTGCVNAQVSRRDARNLPEGKKYDRVLVDAPCSAEGNLREQEDLKSGAAQEKLDSLPKLQSQLLDKAFSMCKPGGTVVYSTCTFAPEENELVVQDFLDRGKLIQPDFDFSHANGVTEWQGEKLDEELENCVRIYPHHLDSGGMFVAKFEKKA